LALLAASALATVALSMAVAGPNSDAQAVRSQQAAAADGIEAVEPALELKVVPGRSKLLRVGADIRRTSVADAGIADVVQVAPRELTILGKAAGKTDVTIWIGDTTAEPVVVLVRVARE